jgi:hypothetical protein
MPRARAGALQERDFQNALMIALCAVAEPRMRVWRQNAGTYQTKGGGVVKGAPAGAADVVGLAWPGVPLAIECKVAPNNQTDAQARWGVMFKTLGGLYVLATAEPGWSAELAAAVWCSEIARLVKAAAAERLH